MEIPTFVWVLVIGLFIFYPIGLWEGRGRGYKKRTAEEEQEKKNNPPAPPMPARTITVDDPGLMRIKNENGFIALDLDGVRADTSALTADQRKRLIEMLNVIRPWLEGRAAPAPAPATMTPPPSSHQPVMPPQTSAPAKPTPQPATTPQASVPAAKPAPVAPAPLGIVGQIDAILQTRLLGTPLEGRGISLGNAPDGGVLVYIGAEKYKGVDEVPDPEVKAAIRGAITAWENKYTPGL